jgi:hypothetical protein
VKERSIGNVAYCARILKHAIKEAKADTGCSRAHYETVLHCLEMRVDDLFRALGIEDAA